MKKVFYGLVFFLIFAFVVRLILPTPINSGKDLPKLTREEILTQSDDDYVLYFYKEGCSYCEMLDADIVQANNADLTLYAVDMEAEENKDLWYDWNAHHEEYDVELGKVVDGKKVYHEGMSESDYQTNEWSIGTVDGKIIARHMAPYINTQPTSLEEIQIAGTPVLIHVKNGAVVKMTGGYNESSTYLKTLIP